MKTELASEHLLVSNDADLSCRMMFGRRVSPLVMSSSVFGVRAGLQSMLLLRGVYGCGLG